MHSGLDLKVLISMVSMQKIEKGILTTEKAREYLARCITFTHIPSFFSTLVGFSATFQPCAVKETSSGSL